MKTTAAVNLTHSEMMQAVVIGGLRHIAAIKRGLSCNHGVNKGGWNHHIEGAAGELAVSKALGRHWGATINTFKSGDDVAGLQVRTRSKDDYDLIIRDDDADEWVFVLVTGRCPNFTIRGWIPARDGKQSEYLQQYGGGDPAYFVPQRELNDIANLPRPAA